MLLGRLKYTGVILEEILSSADSPEAGGILGELPEIPSLPPGLLHSSGGEGRALGSTARIARVLWLNIVVKTVAGPGSWVLCG